MKAGIYPLNPGQITDRQTCPSKVFSTSMPDDSDSHTTSGSDATSASSIVTHLGSSCQSVTFSDQSETNESH